MGSFEYISAFALAGYLVMLLILTAARKNRIVKSFMIVLTAMILWTGGSLLMRKCFWPDYVVWYHISLLGLFLLPYGYYQLIVGYAGNEKDSASGVYLFISALLFGINIPNGFFLAAPEKIGQDSQYIFVYHMNWHVIFLFIGGTAAVAHIVYTFWKICKKDNAALKAFAPILGGIAVLFGGHVALMFPIFAGFPVDILSGLLNAVIIMFAIGKRRLFRLRLAASERVCYGIGLVLNLIFYFSFAPYLTRVLHSALRISSAYDVVIFISCFVVTTVLVTGAGYVLMKKILTRNAILEDAEADVLTGLLNRKSFLQLLEEEIENHRECGHALILLSIDDFKLFNQIYGTEKGDRALKAIADIIKEIVGKSGYAARYTGRQFALLMPGCDTETARKFTEVLQQRIMDLNGKAGENNLQLLTVSAGISGIPESAKNAKELLEAADLAIHHIKRSSRNAIHIFNSTDRENENENDRHAPDKHRIYQEYEITIRALTEAIHTKDHYTFQHSENVAYYATELARIMHMNEDLVEIVRQAALLHDIGKIGISEAVLNKPGKLSEEEYEAIKGHVGASIGIIRHLPSLDYVIPAVISHHERYDGGGYPRGLAGEEIPVIGRILSVADAFDAMISERCYRRGMELAVVLEILKIEEGKQFDPQFARIFADSVRTGRIQIRRSE